MHLLTGCASTEELYAQYDEQVCLVENVDAEPQKIIVREYLTRNTLAWQPAVYFDYKRDFLNAAERERLLENIEVLSRYPELRVVVRGFADERGSRRYNRNLAERRVRFVMNFIAGRGVARHRMEAMPLGEELPFLNARNETVFAINRRVELLLMDGSGRPVSYRVDFNSDVMNANPASGAQP